MNREIIVNSLTTFYKACPDYLENQIALFSKLRFSFAIDPKEIERYAEMTSNELVALLVFWSNHQNFKTLIKGLAENYCSQDELHSCYYVMAQNQDLVLQLFFSEKSEQMIKRISTRIQKLKEQIHSNLGISIIDADENDFILPLQRVEYYDYVYLTVSHLIEIAQWCEKRCLGNGIVCPVTRDLSHRVSLYELVKETIIQSPKELKKILSVPAEMETPNSYISFPVCAFLWQGYNTIQISEIKDSDVDFKNNRILGKPADDQIMELLKEHQQKSFIGKYYPDPTSEKFIKRLIVRDSPKQGIDYSHSTIKMSVPKFSKDFSSLIFNAEKIENNRIKTSGILYCLYQRSLTKQLGRQDIIEICKMNPPTTFEIESWKRLFQDYIEIKKEIQTFSR